VPGISNKTVLEYLYNTPFESFFYLNCCLAPTPGDKLSYINYIKNVLTVHVKIADKLLEFIPEFKTVSARHTKQF
jgi:hypothetical protein